MKSNASLSLDLDNKWSYLKIHGDSGWESFPSYLDVVIPRILEVLDELDNKITVFVVGRDAVKDENKKLLQTLLNNGHELGNHSFSHETWFHLQTQQEIEEEVERTEKEIMSIGCERPIGFRGPGFTWSPDLLEVLARRHYLYDATTLPTFIGPIARLYYFRISNLTEEQKEKRKRIFASSIMDGIRPIRPFHWNLPSNARILEIPVTTIPILRIPFHMTYLLYLSRFSDRIMWAYFRLALALCQLTKTMPSFLLHPLDLLDGDEVPELSFFPGMDINVDIKRRLLVDILKELNQKFNVTNLSTHARFILEHSAPRIIEANKKDHPVELRNISERGA